MTNIIKGEAQIEKGLGLPIMTTTERLAYTPSTNGYVVFDIDLEELFYWTNEWKSMFIVRRLQKGTVYNVKNYPFTWIDNTLYTTDKGNSFSTFEEYNIPLYTDYNGVTTIDLNTQGLTTDFSSDLLSKYKNLTNLTLNDNFITDIDLSKNNSITNANLTNNLLDINQHNQIYIDLDNSNVSSGVFTSTLSGTGSISDIAVAAYISLQNKNWVLSGLRGTTVGESKATVTDKLDEWIAQDGSTVNVEDYPLLWIEETYYNTYNGNTFVLPTNAGNDIWAGDAIDYAGVTFINLNGNSLTTNFSTNLLSKFKNIELLYLYDNSITFVDVSVLTKATVIVIFKNALTGSYDFTNNTLVTELNIRNNNITSVDVSTCLALDFFSCQNNDLTALDVTNNTALTDFQAFNNSLTNVDVSNNTALTLLYLFNNSLTSIDVSNNILLEQLYLQSNDLTDLDISSNTLLTNLRVQNNELDNLVNSQILIDLDGHGLSNGYFQSSIFGGGYLSPLGVEAFINIQSKGWTIVGLSILLTTSTSYDIEYFPLAWIEENNFSTYNADTFQVASDRNMPTQSQNDAVTSINLQNQSLTTDITFLNKFGNLTDLQCRNNSISTLDVSNSTNLTMLKCQDNNISTLDVSSLTDLINLRCQRNNISTLEVSTLINLTELQCQTNNISTLDVSTLTNLTELQCQANSISTLDVSSLTNLIDLQCYNNAISTLDISDLTSLTTVQCENNTISNLDVSNLTILNDLRCANNQLDNLVNSQILIDLDGHGLSNGYLQSSIFGSGSLTTAGTTAKTNLSTKGWTIVGL